MLLVMVLLLAFQAKAADPDYIQGPDNTYWVTCNGGTGKKIVQSPIFTAARSAWSAFVRVTAQADERSSCSNSSELLIKRAGEHSFSRVYGTKGSEYLLGNGMKVIDWSPDGRFLLIDLIQWQYSPDALVDRSLLLFDFSKGTVTPIDYTRVFAGDPKDGLTEVRGLGFTPDSEIVVRASSRPFYEEGAEKPMNPACPTYSRLWQISLGSSSPKRLASDFKVRRYARVQRSGT